MKSSELPSIRRRWAGCHAFVDFGLEDGMTAKDSLAEFRDLEVGDIDEALHFAADAVRERQLPLG